MARPSGPKTRAGGLWTDARHNQFVRSNLRMASRKWPPIAQCLKNARVERGFYLCATCKEIVPATIKVEGKRVKNIHVDHIEPVVDPAVGFVDWNTYIERLYTEPENLQAICDKCHTIKTNNEKAIAKERRMEEYDE